VRPNQVRLPARKRTNLSHGANVFPTYTGKTNTHRVKEGEYRCTNKNFKNLRENERIQEIGITCHYLHTVTNTCKNFTGYKLIQRKSMDNTWSNMVHGKME
jgi:hypothetical protein